ncbi:hypothetical protein [Octadecabacter sp. R77987]|uniref:hypothetical protein n=1 Tax=Octadecabacter sp. R77987 TaxID=3093874 RepID=UPI003670957D
MIRIFGACLVSSLASLSSYAQADVSFDDKETILAEFVRQLPRGMLGVPDQWLEMETVIGWEKMILLVGYANNEAVCSRMLVIAKQDSPDRNFRCTAAN